MRFRALPPPDDEEVRRVLRRVTCRVRRLLERCGLGPEAPESDAFSDEQPLLAGLAAASVRGRAGNGRFLTRRGDRVDAENRSDQEPPRCAALEGFSLHADVAIPSRDRNRLERLCRYAARPPLATERLAAMEDGRLLYRLRHPWRDGTAEIVFAPQELLQRLVPLVPAPGAHLVRYHGVLAPCASWRERVVPDRLPSWKTSPPACGVPRQAPGGAIEESAAGAVTGSGGSLEAHGSPPSEGLAPASAAAAAPPREENKRGGVPDDVSLRRRHAWADLMRRVFALDVLQCPRCGDRLRILAAIHPPETTRAILECVGLPSRAPPLAPAHRELKLADW